MRPAADSLAAPRVRRTLLHDARTNWQLHLLLLLPLIYLLVFKYVPMWGAQIAFRDFFAVKGIFGSPWVGHGQLRPLLRVAAVLDGAQEYPRAVRLSDRRLVSDPDHPRPGAQQRRAPPLQEDGAVDHLRPALHLHGGDGGHDHALPGAAHRGGQQRSGGAGAGADLVHEQPGAVSIGVRGFRHLAERRLGHHHLPGSARRRRPAAARGGDRGTAPPSCSAPAISTYRASCRWRSSC